MTPAPKPLTTRQIVALADQLRTLLDYFAEGTIDASTATRYRIEGAVAALDAALGRPTTLFAAKPDGPTSPVVDNK